MATVTIIPDVLTRAVDNWPNGNVGDIDEGIPSADGVAIFTLVDGEGEVVDVGFTSPGLSDADTITQVDIIIRSRSGGASATSVISCQLLIGSVLQGSSQSTPNQSSFANDTLNDVGWNSDWTASQLDGLEFRMIAVQSGMPTAERYFIDTIDVVITYTPAAAGPSIPIAMYHHMKHNLG